MYTYVSQNRYTHVYMCVVFKKDLYIIPANRIDSYLNIDCTTYSPTSLIRAFVMPHNPNRPTLSGNLLNYFLLKIIQ